MPFLSRCFTALVVLSCACAGPPPAQTPAASPAPVVQSPEPTPPDPPPAAAPAVVEAVPPNEDPDHDGFVAGGDACPEQPELINAVDDTDGCPDEGPDGIRLFGNLLEGPETIRFETGKATVHPSSATLVEAFGSLLATNPKLGRVVIGVHSDGRGSSEYNQALTQARANALRDAFVASGVASGRLKAIGYGESRPIVCNTCPPGWAGSRRVEIRLPEVDDK